jgi:HD-GYP domain-containing protein (c-di-GMP phosphodiesterase class II)
MKVPDEVLNKPGRLTDAEFDLIKQHPGDGHAVLLETPGIGPIPLDITRHHHERLDGKGYPDRLAGDAISTMARMAAIVDVYDAITADRCYHKGMPAAEALRKMWEWSSCPLRPEAAPGLHALRRHLSGRQPGTPGVRSPGRGDRTERRQPADPEACGYSLVPNPMATSNPNCSTWGAS